jgi:hypothetical protein
MRLALQVLAHGSTSSIRSADTTATAEPKGANRNAALSGGTCGPPGVGMLPVVSTPGTIVCCPCWLGSDGVDTVGPCPGGSNGERGTSAGGGGGGGGEGGGLSGGAAGVGMTVCSGSLGVPSQA